MVRFSMSSLKRMIGAQIIGKIEIGEIGATYQISGKKTVNHFIDQIVIKVNS